MNEPAVRLQNVVKRYVSGPTITTAVDDLSLEIGVGEFTSLMGPSGSGKSTLLNVIAGLDAPDGGRVILAGVDVGSLRDHELANLRLRTIGFVFQNFNLLPALTVERNVAWPLQFAGHSRSAVHQRTHEVLARVGLSGCEARYPSELSGGEQQRVAIARAIAPRPLLLLADEPTGNLDSRTGQSILDLLRTLNLEDGVTVVMVTHSTLAAAYGDRTLELQDGRIVRDVRVPSQENKVVSLQDRRSC